MNTDTGLLDTLYIKRLHKNKVRLRSANVSTLNTSFISESQNQKMNDNLQFRGMKWSLEEQRQGIK